MSPKKYIIAAIIAVLVAVGLSSVISSAGATGGDDCVPTDAIAAQHYSWTGGPLEDGVIPPPPPAGEWQANTTQEPHSSENVTWLDTEGAGLHYTSHGSSGLADWFYFQPAVDAVECPPEECPPGTTGEYPNCEPVVEPNCENAPSPETCPQPDAVVTEDSSTGYKCGDAFQTITTVTTTTPYVWDEASMSWVLANKGMSVTTTETVPVDVVPCDEQPPVKCEAPGAPYCPVDHPSKPEPNNDTKRVAVPTVVDSGV